VTAYIYKRSTHVHIQTQMSTFHQHVFVDLSYFTIHRYFAVLRYFKLSKKEDATQEEVFERFALSFNKSIKSLLFKYEVTEPVKLYFAQDCPRSEIWRNELWPTYKGARVANQAFDPAIFKYVLETVLPAGGWTVVKYPRAEADDVIAIAHKMIRGNGNDKILIVTNDHDYLQLYDEFTTIVNGNDELILSKYNDEILKVILEYKIIRGDVSDNIPSIGRLIGEKTAKKLALDQVALNKKLENPAVLEQYVLNRKLMSFAEIPEDIVKGIIDALAAACVVI